VNAWGVYKPSGEAPWDLHRVVHLHRRAGFAAAWEEIERDLKDGPGPSIDRLLAGQVRSRRVPDDFESIAALLAEAATPSPIFGDTALRLKAWWIYRAPANHKEHPNENLARELLELFTLGLDHYTEMDVREAARALTGWTTSQGRFRHIAAQSGYDTHYFQLPAHAALLAELSGALRAFLDDLAAAKLAERVVVLCFSEFGRRVAENGSDVTDHGTAGPVLLAGPMVRPGLVGPTPNLLDLHDGDLKWSIDFRRVYATVLEHWLGLSCQVALGETIPPLPLFRG